MVNMQLLWVARYNTWPDGWCAGVFSPQLAAACNQRFAWLMSTFRLTRTEDLALGHFDGDVKKKQQESTWSRQKVIWMFKSVFWAVIETAGDSKSAGKIPEMRLRGVEDHCMPRSHWKRFGCVGWRASSRGRWLQGAGAAPPDVRPGRETGQAMVHIWQKSTVHGIGAWDVSAPRQNVFKSPCAKYGRNGWMWLCGDCLAAGGNS